MSRISSLVVALAVVAAVCGAAWERGLGASDATQAVRDDAIAPGAAEGAEPVATPTAQDPRALLCEDLADLRDRLSAVASSTSIVELQQTAAGLLEPARNVADDASAAGVGGSNELRAAADAVSHASDEMPADREAPVTALADMANAVAHVSGRWREIQANARCNGATAAPPASASNT
jgi:hypothetical protein